jgi:hypothetical protein
VIRPTDYPLTVSATSEQDARDMVKRRAAHDGFRVVQVLRSYRSVMPGQWTVVLSVIPATPVTVRLAPELEVPRE